MIELDGFCEDCEKTIPKDDPIVICDITGKEWCLDCWDNPPQPKENKMKQLTTILEIAYKSAMSYANYYIRKMLFIPQEWENVAKKNGNNYVMIRHHTHSAFGTRHPIWVRGSYTNHPDSQWMSSTLRSVSSGTVTLWQRKGWRFKKIHTFKVTSEGIKGREYIDRKSKEEHEEHKRYVKEQDRLRREREKQQ